MFCPNCNAKINENDKFCSNCGFFLKEESTQNHTEPNNQTSSSNPSPNQQFIGYCKNCGNPLYNNSAVCLHCGVSSGTGNSFCANCGKPIDPNASVCLNCGFATNKTLPCIKQKSKIAAGILGIFLGGFGVHNFYLGYNDKAIIQLLLSVFGIVFSCLVFGIFMSIGASIWGLVEGIMILTDKINVDASGIPLQ